MISKLLVSTDKEKLNVTKIHDYLVNHSYWGQGRTIEQVKTSLHNSMCFGGYVDGIQVAFARVVTDTVSFAYLLDVIVFPGYQRLGYSKLLLQTIIEHRKLKTVNWLLRTEDAHFLYEKFGFSIIDNPEDFMIKKGKTSK